MVVLLVTLAIIAPSLFIYDLSLGLFAGQIEDVLIGGKCLWQEDPRAIAVDLEETCLRLTVM